MEKYLCNINSFTFFYRFDICKDMGQNIEFCVVRIVPCHAVFTMLHICMPHSLVCAFLCWLLHDHQYCVLYYVVSLFSCFSQLYSLLVLCITFCVCWCVFYFNVIEFYRVAPFSCY